MINPRRYCNTNERYNNPIKLLYKNTVLWVKLVHYSSILS